MRWKVIASWIAAFLFATTVHAQVLADNNRGFVLVEGNELEVGAKIDDADKLRLTQPITEHGGGGGVISFNLHKFLDRVASGHEQTEMAMIRVEQASDVRGTFLPKGEFNFFANDGGEQDSNMKRVFSFTWNEVTFLQPGIAAGLAQRIAPYLTPTDGGYPDTLWAPDGLTFTQQQSDGNFVSYRVTAPYDKSASPCAMWSAWTGFIGSCQ